MPRVRAELSRIVSSSISPQSPCTFELPFSALVRFCASVEIVRLSSMSCFNSAFSSPRCEVCVV